MDFLDWFFGAAPAKDDGMLDLEGKVANVSETPPDDFSRTVDDLVEEIHDEMEVLPGEDTDAEAEPDAADAESEADPNAGDAESEADPAAGDAEGGADPDGGDSEGGEGI
ncbi:MAG TPA: hypothetical protein VKW08_00220 [Xanthobacteraceae bacterium]|nr:hypothetical protein [Xanthobacteraceae bacterium]